MGDPREGLNADGTIRTGVDPSRIPEEFQPVVTAVTSEFAALDDEAAELYLYGSVASGTARRGRSDVDLIAIGVREEWCRQTGQQLTSEFSGLCRGVEIGHGTRSDFLSDSDEAYGNRVFLRHYCLPLAGRAELRPAMPFQGDARAARGFNGDIGGRLAQWRSGSPRARNVARKTLFAAAGVVSVLDGTWTTDRGIASRRCAEMDPGRAEEMARLAHWAEDDGEASAVDLAAALAPGGVVAAVVDQFEAVIGLWP